MSEDDADMADGDVDEPLNSFDNSSMSSSRSSSNISTSKQSLFPSEIINNTQRTRNLNEHKSRPSQAQDDDSEQNSCNESNHSGRIYDRSPPRNTNASTIDHFTSGSSDQTSDKRYRPQKFCAVCGDRAIACNFNAVTCESCKKLKCLFEDKCVIDKVTRRFCSRCRLKKCIDIGMKREWILSDEEKFNKRMKIIQNRQKRVRSTSQEGQSMTAPNGNVNIVRQIEKRDASTSCPDESDLATGEGPGFFYCSHQCQNCHNIMKAKSSQALVNKISTRAKDNVKSFSSENQFVSDQSNKSQLTGNCSPSYCPGILSQFMGSSDFPTTNGSCTSNSTIQPTLNHLNYSQSVYIPPQNIIGSMSDASVSDRCNMMSEIQKSPSRSNDEAIFGSIYVTKEDHGYQSHQGEKNLSKEHTPDSVFTTTDILPCYHSFITGASSSSCSQNNPVTYRQELNRSSCDCHPITYDFDLNTSGVYADMSANMCSVSDSKNEESSADLFCHDNETTGQNIVIARGSNANANDSSNSDNVIRDNDEIYQIDEELALDTSDQGRDADFLIDDSAAKELAKQNTTILSSSTVILPDGLISCDGGETVFARPCETEADIEARLSSIDLYGQERAKIEELLQAAKFLFEANQEPPNKMRTGDSLVELVQVCDYSLRRFIKTVKQVNAFKILTMDDQIALLKTACFKILILRSAHNFTDSVYGWRDAKTGRILSLEVLKRARKSSVYEQHKNLLITFDRPLRQDRIIVGLLCMIILFDTSNFKNFQHGHAIHLEHVNYLCILKKYLLCTQPDPLSKYEKLMAALKQINATNEEYNNFFSKDFQPAQITPLIVEIFDIGSI